jgi:hypothetical protein
MTLSAKTRALQRKNPSSVFLHCGFSNIWFIICIYAAFACLIISSISNTGAG